VYRLRNRQGVNGNSDLQTRTGRAKELLFLQKGYVNRERSRLMLVVKTCIANDTYNLGLVALAGAAYLQVAAKVLS
jgi:hypothetical protein